MGSPKRFSHGVRRWTLCLFALLAAVDLALTIIDPDRPMHVAQLILGPLLRLSGLFTLGM